MRFENFWKRVRLSWTRWRTGIISIAWAMQDGVARGPLSVNYETGLQGYSTLDPRNIELSNFPYTDSSVFTQTSEITQKLED